MVLEMKARVEQALSKVETKPFIGSSSIYEQQMKTNDVTIPVGYFMTALDIYANIPTWQRNPVWSESKKQKLINTILENGYIPPIVVYPDSEDVTKNWVLDGQQRLTAIRQFIEGSFKTGTSKGRGRYLEPGKHFAELSDPAKKRILNFHLKFTILQETDQERLRDQYKAMQNLSPLKSSEIAYASDSLTREAALELEHHLYFKQIYTGGNERHEVFQMALSVLGIEIYGGIVNLDANKLNLLANGSKDEYISSELVIDITSALYRVMEIFKGVQTRSNSALILMYQACYFLRVCGYALEEMEHGILAKWFSEQLESKRSNVRAFVSPISQIYKASFQHTFWALRLPELVKIVDSSEESVEADNADRLSCWFRNNHICPACNNSIPVTNIRKHAFRIGDRCEA